MNKVNHSTGKLKPEHDPNNQRKKHANWSLDWEIKLCKQKVCEMQCKCKVGDSEM